MCGICGIAPRSEAEPVSADLIGRMCRTIIHRGPDDEGIHVEPGIGLGVRRLSIIDVEGGHQPLANEDGSIWAAQNGEIYNFLEVKKELESRGHRFRTRTDTETIVHAYEEWGEGFVQKLRGMFAIAVWDRTKKRLLLFRDRIGVKPLYYTFLEDGTLVFGSEIKAIIAHPGVKRALEPQALDLFLTLEYVPAPLSIFKGIHKLPAGSFFTYKQGETWFGKYWDIEPAPAGRAETRPLKSTPEITDELYALLKESVKLRLISDVPLGAFLSGGIDSSTIVGLMRELGAEPLKTFSIGFKDQSYNELGYARKIAEKFETDHEEYILEPEALELTETLIRHLDEPLGDFSIFPTYLVSKMARSRVTVALSGDGGDEVFGGYEHYQAQKISRIPPVSLLARILKAPVGKIPPSKLKKGTWNKLRRFAQGFENPSSLRHFRWMMFMTRDLKERLYSETLLKDLGGLQEIDEREPFLSAFGAAKGFDRLNRELFLDLKTYLPDNIMVKVDRMSMATSLEAREPLLDHKLVEFAFRLPGRCKLRGFETKWIFKKTVERLLPRENIYRPKEGFSIPIRHWLRNELRNMLCDYLNEERIKKEGLFHFAPIREMRDAHLEGRENFSHQLWALLVFEIWREHYLA